jgi:hypothetical protein
MRLPFDLGVCLYTGGRLWKPAADPPVLCDDDAAED